MSNIFSLPTGNISTGTTSVSGLYQSDLYSQSFGSYKLSTSALDALSVTSTMNGQGVTITKGDLNVEDGDILIKGKRLSSVLEALEEKLAVLIPNPKLEQEWKELKDLRDKYQKLEKELLSKQSMWNILKDVSTSDK